jgi:hypothetical protein
MKKTLLIVAAVALVFGAAFTASAATTVQVTLTSPTITKAVKACEKGGAVTFQFPAGSVLQAGDWWYMDLPEGATLCKDIDYLIISDTFVGGSNNHYVYADSTLPTYVKFLSANDKLGGATGNIIVGAPGPMSTVAIVGGGHNTTVAGNMAIRVVGQSGSRRVTLYVASDNVSTANPAPANDKITVGADSALNIKILDGSQNKGTAAVGTGTRVITDTNKQAFSDTAGTVSTTGKYRAYGQTTTDALPASASDKSKVDEYVGFAGGQVPFVENTLCVTAHDAVGNLFVSFASLNDKFTFTGDSQIAHTGTANTISLLTCLPAKETQNDTIKIGGQGECSFEYDAHTSYCSTYDARVYLASDSVFGELNDLYDVTLESKTAGVYFMDTFTLNGLTTTQVPCTDAGTPITLATTDYSSGTSNKKDNADIAFATSAGCTVETKNKIDKLYSYGGSITGVQNYRYLVFGLPTFVYDSSVVKEGTEVDLAVTLNKYPCGQIFTDTVTIGTFVTTCTTTSGSTTLMYPYLIGTKYAGWFAGYVITNGGTTAGTATLTAVDDNGNKATFTTPSISAMGTYNASFMTVADWTQDAGNSANFDMTENFVVKVLCNFDNGGGMAFLGNTNEGYAIGYDAYTTDW